MTSIQKPHLLFAAYMAGGNRTLLKNLQARIGPRPDLDSAFVGVEMEDHEHAHGRENRRPLIPGSIRNSRRAGAQIRALEQQARAFDAAFFFQHTICIGLWRFRRRVPYLVAMDGTPAWYNRLGLSYAYPLYDPDAPASRVRNAIIGSVYRGAHHVLALSYGVLDSLIRDYGVSPERVTMTPPGIDLDLFEAPDRRAALDATRAFRVLCVAADFERKGGRVLLEVATRPEFRDVEFHVVSGACPRDRPANVHVHDDVKSNSPRLLELLRQADVFALPTLADSHSVASLEAMAMGLPVVTTPVGGIVDIVAEGETGYLVPVKDADALADRLMRLRSDPGLRIDMGEKARRRVESTFNGERIAERTVELMFEAAARRRGPRQPATSTVR